MAFGGRGRGRGRGAIFLKESRPGGLQETEEAGDELSDLIEKLTVAVDKNSVKSVVDVATKQATDKESMERIVKAIYEPCYKDWRFSGPAASVCQQLVPIEADGVKFRSVLLRTIQEDYKDKESTRENSNAKFVGFLAFLCQVFSKLKSADGTPFKPLIAPILSCMEMSLDGSATEEELECACEQLLCVGALVDKHGDAGRLRALASAVRDHILDKTTKREVRSRLIDIIEAIASNWTLHVSNVTS